FLGVFIRTCLSLLVTSGKPIWAHRRHRHRVFLAAARSSIVLLLPCNTGQDYLLQPRIIITRCPCFSAIFAISVSLVVLSNLKTRPQVIAAWFRNVFQPKAQSWQ